MEFDNKTLAQYLVEVKRIEESRSKGADKEIRSLYKALLKNLNSFIGEYYTKYSNDDGILNVAILQQKAQYSAFLEEVDKNIREITPEISKSIKKAVESTYKACYDGMVKGFGKSAGEKFKESFKGLSIQPEVMKAAVENPISGLTLPERLQKHRQDVIYDIKTSISNSLMTGERFDTTSKKLVERLDISYGKANRIVRTESHRVQEKGLLDGAEAVGDKVKDDGLVYAVIWRNMGDEKVRPNIRVRTPKGWKTYKSKTKANHIKMEGQVVEVGGYFDLGNGVKAKSPGESGTPENDCNCRCYLDYEMMTVEEFQERGGRWKDEQKFVSNDKFTSGINSDIIKTDRMATQDESITWLPKNSNITSEQYKDLKKYAENKGVSLRGFKKSDVDIKLVQDVIDDCSKMFEIYPELKGTERKPFTLELSYHMKDDDFAETTPNITHIVKLNGNAFRNREKLAEEYSKLEQSGWFVKGTDYHSIIRHEMGHLYGDIHKIDGLKIAKEVTGKTDVAELMLFLEDNVSIYASSYIDGTEIISEVFSDFYSSKKTSEFTAEFIRRCFK